MPFFKSVGAFIRGNDVQRTSNNKECPTAASPCPDLPPSYEPPSYDSDLPTYDSLYPAPESRSVKGRITGLFNGAKEAGERKPEPVSAGHKQTLAQIDLAEAELCVSRRLQAAMAYEEARRSDNDNDNNDNANDDLARPPECSFVLHAGITSLIGVNLDPHLCLPDQPRAYLVNRKLKHLRALERMHRILADNTATMEEYMFLARTMPRRRMVYVQSVKAVARRQDILTMDMEVERNRIRDMEHRWKKQLKEYDNLGCC
ncbi:hypothetical protein F4808DRAFT_464039 [Astrocystis sublimbata]|nr:hypothetical protein F4808DRAFT_464039 [Astrocystis sublimbata]